MKTLSKSMCEYFHPCECSWIYRPQGCRHKYGGKWVNYLEAMLLRIFHINFRKWTFMYFSKAPINNNVSIVSNNGLASNSSVPNYCQSVCPKQTTLEEGQQLFSRFLKFYFYDLRFKAVGLTTFLTEFWTLPTVDKHGGGIHFTRALVWIV